MSDFKTCPRCLKEFPVEGYTEKARRKYVWACSDCRSEYLRDQHAKHRSKRISRGREVYREVRKTVLTKLGGKCDCCGESTQEFLAIDHRFGGGNIHRRALGIKSSVTYYRWLLDHDCLPSYFRLLCHNCNMARSFYDHCPHESQREGRAAQALLPLTTQFPITPRKRGPKPGSRNNDTSSGRRIQ